MTTILFGNSIAKEILKAVASETLGRHLKLAVVQVGANPVSEKYVQEKQKAAALVGVIFEVIRFPRRISQERLRSSVQEIGRNLSVAGLIVQLPLPKHLNTQEILDAIPLEKDVDVLSSSSFGLFALGRLPVLPPTVGAVARMLKDHRITPAGKHVVLVGTGRLVGLPLSLWLLRERATLSVANSSTKNLSSLTQKADILISGTGRAKLITGRMVKKGAVVLDAGTSVERGLTRGDVDFASVSKKASLLAPVPGGIGPLTVATLFQNLAVLSQTYAP